jgi:hypothetical protein
MKRTACLVVALGFSSPLFAQSNLFTGFSPFVGNALQDVPGSSLSSTSTQPSPGTPPFAKTLSLAGPRFGLTILSDATVAKLREIDIDVSNTISQFGWQFEHEFYSKQDGPFAAVPSKYGTRVSILTGFVLRR